MRIQHIITFLKMEWIWFKLSYTFRFAHHPLCDRYKDQRFKIGNIHLCQGCTLTTIGILIAFTFTLFAIPILQTFTIVQLIGIAVLTISPALIIDGLNSSRMWKRFARLFTGSGVGVGIATALFHTVIIIRVIAIFIIIAFWFGYKKYRKMNPAKDLCVGCKYLQDQPCPGFATQFTANKLYTEQTRNLLYEGIELRMQEIQQQYNES